MKIKKNNNLKKPLLIAGGVLVIIGIIIVIWLNKQPTANNTDSDKAFKVDPNITTVDENNNTTADEDSVNTEKPDVEEKPASNTGVADIKSLEVEAEKAFVPQLDTEIDTEKPATINIHESIDKVVSAVVNYHYFADIDAAHFDKVQAMLKNYNITTTDAEYLRSIYDNGVAASNSKSTVFSSYAYDGTVKRDSKNTYTISVKTRSAVSPVLEKTSKDVGRNLINYLRTPKYADLEKVVQYKLKVADDGEKGTLTLLTHNWWKNK